MNSPANSWIPPTELNTVKLEGAPVYGLAEVERPLGKITHVERDGTDTKVTLKVSGSRGGATDSITLDLAQLSFIRSARGIVYARANMENLLNLGR